MPNYEIQIQVTIRETDQAVAPEAHQAADGSFRTVVSGASGQRIDECERALLAVNYPALREAFSRHLSEVSQQEAARDGVGRVKKSHRLLGRWRNRACKLCHVQSRECLW